MKRKKRGAPIDLSFPALAAARAAADRLNQAAFAPFPPLDSLPDSIAPTIMEKRFGAAMAWSKDVEAAAQYAENLFSSKNLVGKPFGCMWSAFHVLGPLEARFEVHYRPHCFAGYPLIQPRPGERWEKIPLHPDRWPEIKDTLRAAYLVTRANAIQFAAWIRGRVHEVEEALVPTIHIVVEKKRGNVEVEVSLAGTTRPCELSDTLRRFLSELKRDGEATLRSKDRSQLRAALPELEGWIESAGPSQEKRHRAKSGEARTGYVRYRALPILRDHLHLDRKKK